MRSAQVRNLLATLLLAQGTPMLLAGDEFRRTQAGNNNAYCQDNELTWVDWSLRDAHADLVSFVQNLTHLRKTFPILRRGRFLTGAYDETLDVKDVTWIDSDGQEMAPDAWGNKHCFGMRVDGRAQPTGIRKRGVDATLLIVFNAHHDPVPFVVPETSGGTQWMLIVDTTRAEPAPENEVSFGDAYTSPARSLQLFVLT